MRVVTNSADSFRVTEISNLFIKLFAHTWSTGGCIRGELDESTSRPRLPSALSSSLRREATSRGEAPRARLVAAT